jgi:hypothetical protein
MFIQTRLQIIISLEFVLLILDHIPQLLQQVLFWWALDLPALTIDLTFLEDNYLEHLYIQHQSFQEFRRQDPTEALCYANGDNANFLR